MTGMLMVDDSCYRFLGPRDLSNLECAGVMEQVSYTVHPTRTEYLFRVQQLVELTLTFTTPARLDSID